MSTPIRVPVPIDWNAIVQTTDFSKIIKTRRIQLETMKENGLVLLGDLEIRLQEKIASLEPVLWKRREVRNLQRSLEIVRARISELRSGKDASEFESKSKEYVIAHARQIEEDARRASSALQKNVPIIPAISVSTPGSMTPQGLTLPSRRPSESPGAASSSSSPGPGTGTGSTPSSALDSKPMDVNKTGDIVKRMYKAISDLADDKDMPLAIENAGEIVQHMLSAISAAPVIVKATRNNMCRFCKVPLMISTEAQLKICPSCRSSSCYANSTSSAMQYGEGYESRCTWYPPGSHLPEVLTKQTGRTRSDVSVDVQAKIARELAKMGFKKNEEITQPAVYAAIHRLNMGNNISKHIPQITNQLSGRPIPQFTREQHIKIKIVYRILQRLFSIMYVGNQFFTAKFVMYKICQIFGWTEMFECFPLTSGIDNVEKSVAMWNKMMETLGWPIIPNFV